MLEVELRFQVPPARRRALQRAMATASARAIRLRAQYVDTPDRRLARAGLALRLRREGRRLVQTLKGEGDGMIARLEHEVALTPGQAAAGVDVSRHAGTRAGDRLAAALGEAAGTLGTEFRTDVKRTLRVVRRDGARVEVALDIGELAAGDARTPLHEIEFELQGGPVEGLFALARDWVGRYGLWLDVRSKAERGDRLARGVEAAPPARTTACALDRSTPPDTALRTMVASGLAPLLALVADLAAGVGGAEHVHQARVGMRRLRALLREFGAWSADVDPDWEGGLAHLFQQLGATRDRDVLAGTVLPELVAAGSPLTELPPSAAGDPGSALRSAGCTRLLLALLEFATVRPAATTSPSLSAPPSRTSSAAPSVRSQDRGRRLAALVAERLDRLHRRLRSDARRFDELDDAARHRARKRLKRLRYCAEAVASLYPGKCHRRYVVALRRAQEAIGRWCDLRLAEDAFHQIARDDPRAWFAVGWLAAERARQLRPAGKRLRALARAERFWGREAVDH